MKLSDLRPIDIYEDGGEYLAATVERDDIPAFAKTARYSADDEPQHFAVVLVDDDGASRKNFSLADPGNLYFSSVYLQGKAQDLPADVVKTAAMNIGACLRGLQMGVPPDLLALAGVDDESQLRSIDPVVKLASKDSLTTSKAGRVMAKSDSGVNITSGVPSRYSGPPTQKLTKGAAGMGAALQKVASFDAVAAAMDRFEAEHHIYLPADKVKIATMLADHASDIGIQPGPALSLYGFGDFDLPTALMAIDARQAMRPDGEYGNLAKVAAQLDPEQLPIIIQNMDLEYGLDRYWGSGLPDPLASVMLSKFAAQELEGPETVTSVDAVKALLESNPEVLLASLSPATVASLSKDPATAFNALPDPQKELVAKAAQGAV
jgi:hypothetical protein